MQLVPYVATGRRLVFMPPGRFDPDVAGEIVERERVTSLGGVPTVVAAMLAAGVHERYDLSSVQQVSYGGARQPRLSQPGWLPPSRRPAAVWPTGTG